MKNCVRNVSLSVFCFFSVIVFPQTIPQNSSPKVTESALFENSAIHPCITPEQYSMLEIQCAESRKELGLATHPMASMATSLGWPLKAAPSLVDCGYYVISAYVDHDATAGIKDFNCGSNTYDTHRGTDISIFPYNFLKMDNNLVQVIAAAAGTILFKSDGNFDKNCIANNLTANYIIIQHADGSQANYWHMKKNSLTSKVVGQTVAAGEFLGIVGSSGSSSGPHLHFEVWSGSTIATRIDPFAGACNTLNSASWWSSQKPYKETSLLKVSVNTTDIVIPPCPATETPNESAIYTIPFQGAGLAPGYAKFYLFIRDELNGLTADLSILNPNASVFTSWNYISASDSKTRIMGYSKKLPLLSGKYTFKATYNGTTCSSTFDIMGQVGMAQPISFPEIKLYPNPTHGNFSVEGLTGEMLKMEIFNTLGIRIWESDISEGNAEVNLDIPSGIYFYQFTNPQMHSHCGILRVQ